MSDSHYRDVLQRIAEKAKACGRNPNDITLVIASKNHPIEKLESLYNEGAREFGESRVQEALTKIPLMPDDCRWHMIGSVQSNKVAKVISCFQLIHSVDTPLLVEKIAHASQSKGITTSLLLQVNTSGEATKHGLTAEMWENSLEQINAFPSIKIEGLMTMAPYADDQSKIRACFRKLYFLREGWVKRMKNPSLFRHLSMGMSHDYLIAIEEGATLLRLGTAIFDGI